MVTTDTITATPAVNLQYAISKPITTGTIILPATTAAAGSV